MGALRVYNTMTREKELFEPLEPNRVSMYVCGVTVYDYCHIGHARCYVAFDTIYRYLRHLGYQVRYVRNFTDVDDKIIQRANALAESAQELSSRFIEAFWEDMGALGVTRADVEPRVTDHMPQIIALIEEIIANGHGYVVGGDVYFDIDSFDAYGKLSRRELDQLRAGASERVGLDERLRNPLDFALWKSSKPGEPTWESPWGPGRPGWHIECSAMSMCHLGSTFDIHGGGKDLIFPHHENEIAQSCAANGAAFARYWLHNGFVNVDNEKMSKSLGNFFTIRDVLDLYHPEVVRYFLLTTHYRNPINYSDTNLDAATRRMTSVYERLGQLNTLIGDLSEGATNLQSGVSRLFAEAMDDDFNTARAIGELAAAFDRIGSLIDDGSAAALTELRDLRADLGPIFAVLGVFNSSPAAFLAEAARLEGRRQQRRLDEMSLSPAEIEALIAKRRSARANRDWALADEIRDKLKANQIELMDSPEATTWRVIKP